jgi:AcrR family transcriptional regulator
MPRDVKTDSARPYHSPLRLEQAEHTRRRILSAARRLFLRQGYVATTIKAVAAEAAVAPDTVYTAFGGKQGLLEGVWAAAVNDPDSLGQPAQPLLRDQVAAEEDPHERLRLLVRLSCQTLARVSPVHAVIRQAADAHPFAADLRARMLTSRLHTQSENLCTALEAHLRDDIEVPEAAAHYSALLSPELFHLLTVEQEWTVRRFETWVCQLLDHDLLGGSQGPGSPAQPR